MVRRLVAPAIHSPSGARVSRSSSCVGHSGSPGTTNLAPHREARSWRCSPSTRLSRGDGPMRVSMAAARRSGLVRVSTSSTTLAAPR